VRFIERAIRASNFFPYLITDVLGSVTRVLEGGTLCGNI
jgi:hypothetical protein